MLLRDQLEQVLRAWNEHELARSAPAVIDFDCHPQSRAAELAPIDRLTAYRALCCLREQTAAGDDPRLVSRIDAHLLYLRALMGERANLDDYIFGTQGCHALGWPESYIQDIGAVAREHLSDVGVGWNAETRDQLQRIELPIDAQDAPDAIRDAASEYEPQVRQLTGSSAPYSLGIETTTINAYWAYWTDGSGGNVRLRLNLREARFTQVQARQFALHEILGHGLQGASYAQRCAAGPVPWVRLLSVHTAQQVLLEGLGQALPLFAAPDDKQLATRVRVDHYTQLVRAALHIALNTGSSISQCADYARDRVPYWTDAEIADVLADRGADTLLRSYLWAYPAGIDWFVHLAQEPANVRRTVLQAAYSDPLTPDDLTALWPAGPAFGGPGRGTDIAP